MEESRIRSLLTELDVREQRPYLRAMSLDYLGGGGSGAWRCKAENDIEYVVKAQNNGQDIQHQYRENGLPLKVLTTELVCGRLGQLFDPIICPPVAVIDIPDKVASANVYPNNGNISVSSGPSFGSQWYPDMIDSKRESHLELVLQEPIARIIVFQTWLRGEDPAALVSADGKKCFSIDHGYYLSGATWDRATLANLLPVSPVRISPFHQQIDATFFEKVLEELRVLSEMDIVKAFAAIPTEWGGTIEFRAELANFVLQRRNLVEQAISSIWKGVPN